MTSKFYYSFNPVWGCYDRGLAPEDFDGHVEAIDPRNGKKVTFQYGEVLDYDPELDD